MLCLSKFWAAMFMSRTAKNSEIQAFLVKTKLKGITQLKNKEILISYFSFKWRHVQTNNE